MSLQEDLFRLEEKFWTEGPEYYARALAPAALMVLPEPTGVVLKDELASSLKAARWSEVLLEEHRLLELTDASALVTYKATAIRDKQPGLRRAREQRLRARRRGVEARLPPADAGRVSWSHLPDPLAPLPCVLPTSTVPPCCRHCSFSGPMSPSQLP